MSHVLSYPLDAETLDRLKRDFYNHHRQRNPDVQLSATAGGTVYWEGGLWCTYLYDNYYLGFGGTNEQMSDLTLYVPPRVFSSGQRLMVSEDLPLARFVIYNTADDLSVPGNGHVHIDKFVAEQTLNATFDFRFLRNGLEHHVSGTIDFNRP